MNEDISHLTAEIERLNTVVSHLTQKNQQLETVISYLIQKDGKDSKDISHLYSEDGKTGTPSSYLSTTDGKADNKTSHLTTEDGKELPDLASLFATKEFKKALFNLLWQQMKRCKWASIHHTSATLMHLYTQSHNSHAKFKSVTQMTDGGVAKHIMMLKKRGFIIKTGFQEFALTQKSIELLKKAADEISSETSN